MMSNFLDDIYDILFRPSQGMEKISKKKNIWHGFLVYTVVSLIVSLANTANQTGQLLEEFQELSVPIELIQGMSRFMPFFNLPFIPLYFFLSAAVLHLTAELLGGEGRVSRLGAVLGYGQIPYIFMVPISLITRYLPIDPTNLFSLIIFIWALVLKVFGIQAVYGFSSGKSLVTYFLPIIILTALLVLFMIFLAVIMAPFLGEFFQY
ncbi:Yip1 family protein [Candidatus Contubernalis alkaliaceticus]|uniref:Yip1 family protein n=1 Tax=Candidatus Contubernalis alkaliaceticus TaxID=338645 RepID=UPI001F4C06B6|nr:Yip1 family protein [Candidatus Contubernalis alkalaceticus]UNC93692.1 YIP1 family protein [Candidatus Contubernalis alkalaceticus]